MIYMHHFMHLAAEVKQIDAFIFKMGMLYQHSHLKLFSSARTEALTSEEPWTFF